MTNEIKAQVKAMLRTGDRLKAIEFLKESYNISSQDATILAEALERETAGINEHTAYSETEPVSRRGSFNLAGCLQTVAKGIGIFTMIAAITSLATALIIFFVQRESISKSDRLTGRVNEMHFLDSGESAPVVLFEWKGEKRVYQSTHYSYPPDYTIGQIVPLFVNRDDPEDITLDTFSERWALIVGFGVIGSGLMLISIVFLYFGGRKF